MENLTNLTQFTPSDLLFWEFQTQKGTIFWIPHLMTFFSMNVPCSRSPVGTYPSLSYLSAPPPGLVGAASGQNHNSFFWPAMVKRVPTTVLDHLLLPLKFHGRSMRGILFFNLASCDPLNNIAHL